MASEGSSANSALDQALIPASLSSEGKVPRLAFAVRLRESFLPTDDIKKLFASWLRDMPAIAEEVKIEAGFDSFSTLLIVSIPFALSAYIPSHPAIMSLGPISSENKIEITAKDGGDIASLKAKITLYLKALNLARHYQENLNRQLALSREEQTDLKKYIKERDASLERIKAHHREELATLMGRARIEED